MVEAFQKVSGDPVNQELNESNNKAFRLDLQSFRVRFCRPHIPNTK